MAYWPYRACAPVNGFITQPYTLQILCRVRHAAALHAGAQQSIIVENIIIALPAVKVIEGAQRLQQLDA